jgi:hypothetical protein
MRIILLMIAATIIIGCGSHQEKTFRLKDECGPVQGNIFHSIPDSDSCRVSCRGNCQSFDMEYKKINFTDNGVKCNFCNCTCKGS